jgi:hypothetical protein
VGMKSSVSTTTFPEAKSMGLKLGLAMSFS